MIRNNTKYIGWKVAELHFRNEWKYSKTDSVIRPDRIIKGRRIALSTRINTSIVTG